MKLNDFIMRLIEIKEKHGDSLQVVMAIPVVEPVFVKNFPKNNKVVITDEK